MRLNTILILSILFSPALKLTAQVPDEKDFNFYSIKEGLTDNRVTAIAQDIYGYIWVATQKGLNRFDGNSFRSFYSDTSTASLPQDYIINLKWLGKEQLAAATLGGLHIVNTRTMTTRNIIIYPDSLRHEYKVNHVQDMMGDIDGNVFILTRSGFYQFNNKDELVFRYDHYRRDQVEKEVLVFGRNMVAAAKGTLLLSTINGLYIYHTEKKDLHPFNNNDDMFFRQIADMGNLFFFKHGDVASFSVQTEPKKGTFYFDLINKTVYPIRAPFDMSHKFTWKSQLFKLNDSLFAITGTDKGFYLIKYNRQANIYEILPKLYFENYYCSFLLTDKEHRLWIGTKNGLFREKRSTGTLETIPVPSSMNPSNLDLSIRSIAVANNKIFLATFSEGLLVLDKHTLQPLKKIEFRQPPATTNVAHQVIVLNNDTVLAGGQAALLYVNTHTLTSTEAILPGFLKQGDWVTSLLRDSKNNIYTGTAESNQFYVRNNGADGFHLARYKGVPLFDIEFPRYIAEDPQGNIWFAGHGMSRFNYSSQQFDLRLDSFPKIKIPRREVSGLLFDPNGKMYFGVRENGLVTYDPQIKKFEHFTRNDGLPDNTIPALYLHKHILWLGTESGLASMDIITKKITSFGISDNMPAGPYTGYSFFYDSSAHQLYGAFNNNILRFNPENLAKSNSPPLFFIESIEIPNETTMYHPGDRIELNYKQNNLVVNLAAINFEDAYQQQFAYRLVKKGNEPWRMIGSQRNVIFSDLSPGKHKLQLKVFIKNNSWPEQVKEIEIYIRPPFWQTTWFLILASLTALSTLYALYRYRIRHIRQKANVDKHLAELEMKGLHSQMNPHFVFNSLNSIREMILHNENKEASHYLSKFAHLIRITLDHSGQSLVSLRNTLEYLERYIEMEQIRNSQFTCTIMKDEALDLDETLMPPMLIQPFIENALWHGVSPGNKDIHIQVEFKKEQDSLICMIDDNGIGINLSVKEKKESGVHHQPVGISNIRNRIALLNEKYNIGCSIIIKDKAELNDTDQTGTLVMLKLPLEIKEE